MPLKKVLYAGIAYLATLLVCFSFATKDTPVQQIPHPYPYPKPPVVKPPIGQGPYEITNQVPSSYLSYEEVKTWMKRWNEEAPEITEFGTYGKNRQGTDLCYLRIGAPDKKRVLIHGAIHGNEKLSTASILGIMGKMLHDYKRDEKVTWIIENRSIYFVPVFSPESYLRSRHIEEGDPNRNWAYPGSRWNNQSSPIQAMQKWFLEMKFCAAMDGHTYGRDFFYPSIARGSDQQKFSKLAREMGSLAGYSPNPVSSGPAGFAIDWYYWKGAVALLTEFGNSGHNPSAAAIPVEVEKTYKAYLHFMREAPEIELEGPDAFNYVFVPPTDATIRMRPKVRIWRPLRRYVYPRRGCYVPR
jgi:hypothetical protein